MARVVLPLQIVLMLPHAMRHYRSDAQMELVERDLLTVRQE